MINYFKNILNLSVNLLSSVFIVKDIDNKPDYYKLLNFNDLKEYNIRKNSIETLNKDQSLLIKNYQLNNINDISTSDLTMIKKLKEEEFLFILYRYMDPNFDIFKVIDIERDYLILINKLKKLFKLPNNKINADIGNIIFIGNFTLKNLDDIFHLISLTKDSYIRITKDELYDTRKLSICYLSCIKFYIKDYKEDNEYDIINISENEKKNK